MAACGSGDATSFLPPIMFRPCVENDPWGARRPARCVDLLLRGEDALLLPIPRGFRDTVRLGMSLTMPSTVALVRGETLLFRINAVISSFILPSLTLPSLILRPPLLLPPTVRPVLLSPVLVRPAPLSPVLLNEVEFRVLE